MSTDYPTHFDEPGHDPATCGWHDCRTAREIAALKNQVAGVTRLAGERMARIERLRKQLAAHDFPRGEAGVQAAEQLAVALERTALEAGRADMLHAALNALAQLPLFALAREHRHLLDDADEALRLSRTRRAATLVHCSSCGAAYGLEEWVGLHGLGLQEQAGLPGDPLELRNCSGCRSTLALPLRRLPVTK